MSFSIQQPYSPQVHNPIQDASITSSTTEKPQELELNLGETHWFGSSVKLTRITESHVKIEFPNSPPKSIEDGDVEQAFKYVLNDEWCTSLELGDELQWSIAYATLLECKQLEKIIIQGSYPALNITERSVKEHQRPFLHQLLTSFPKLTALNLSIKVSLITNEVLEHLWSQQIQYPNIRELTFACTSVTGRSLMFISKTFPNLENLELKNSSISNQGIPYLNKLAHLKTFKFGVDHTNTFTSESASDFAIHPTLEKLTVTQLDHKYLFSSEWVKYDEEMKLLSHKLEESKVKFTYQR